MGFLSRVFKKKSLPPSAEVVPTLGQTTQEGGEVVDASVQQKAGGSEESFLDSTPNSHDRYMNLAVGRHNWMTAFRLTFGLLALSVAFNGYYMSTSKYIPVPVAVDSIGRKIVVGPANAAQPFDQKRALLREVEDYIDAARTITGDNRLQKKLVRYVESRTVPNSSAERAILELQALRPPATTAQLYTYDVENLNIFPETDRTYFVEWQENQRNPGGVIVATEKWKARLSFQLNPGSDSYEDVERNPFGFGVKDLSWSRVR